VGLFGTLGEVFRNLSESSGGQLFIFFQEGLTLQRFDNNLFCLFDDVLSLVVFLLFLSPFFVLKGLLLVEFNDFGFDQCSEVSLFSDNLDFLVSNGDLFV